MLEVLNIQRCKNIDKEKKFIYFHLGSKFSNKKL
jgi:hypothetical protein